MSEKNYLTINSKPDSIEVSGKGIHHKYSHKGEGMFSHVLPATGISVDMSREQVISRIIKTAEGHDGCRVHSDLERAAPEAYFKKTLDFNEKSGLKLPDLRAHLREIAPDAQLERKPA